MTFTFTFTLEEQIRNSFDVGTANYKDTAVILAFSAFIWETLNSALYILAYYFKVVLKPPALSVAIF
jgi:hypothetical protein